MSWWAFRLSVVRPFARYLSTLDPVTEVPTLLIELVAHGPPSDQVVVGSEGEVRHRPLPGHGMASPRNARWSTFA